MRLASLFVLAALAAGAASAADVPPSAQTAAPAPQAQPAKPTRTQLSDSDRIICKRKEGVDTRFPGKTECHSKRWWETQANLYRQDMDDNMTHQHGVDSH
ncbi:MAG TPA: hypothetical protein VG407_18120 [Caulobacteraceae bacterium]|jgi:hypothetical protein|nr:hypothetical protein [Caulobacteraceae bacterium]